MTLNQVLSLVLGVILAVRVVLLLPPVRKYLDRRMLQQIVQHQRAVPSSQTRAAPTVAPGEVT